MAYLDLLDVEARNRQTELRASADHARAVRLARPTPGRLRSRAGHLLVRLGSRIADL